MQDFYIHKLSPIAFKLGDFPVYWYWLFYFLGLIWIILWAEIDAKKNRLSIKLVSIYDYILWGWPALLLTSRLFYVLFYNPIHYFNHPENILQFWKGGMSFHGAILGVTLMSLLRAKQKNENFFHFTDFLVTHIGIVLMLGRIGNFINGELAGSPTQLPWAVIFPKFYDLIPRHPSQIYQALTEGLLLYIVLFNLRNKKLFIGAKSSLFLILYGFFRFLTEFVRLPDKQIGTIFGLSLGQHLCLAMILLGLYLFNKNKNYSAVSS